MYTGDPKTLQFGETTMSGRDICRRAVKLRTEQFTFSPNEEQTFGAKPLLIKIDPFSFDNFRTGMAHKLSHYFKLWRGALQFGVRFKYIDTDPQLNTKAQIVGRLILDDKVGHETASHIYSFDGPTFRENHLVSPKDYRGNSIATQYFNEGEIQWIETPMYLSSGTGIILGNEGVNTINSQATILPSFILALQGFMKQPNFIIEIFFRFGDTAAFGVYTGMTPNFKRVTTYYPDVYTQGDEDGTLDNPIHELDMKGGSGLLSANDTMYSFNKTDNTHKYRPDLDDTDKNYNLSDLHERWNQVATVEWPLTAPENTLLQLNGKTYIDIPFDLMQNSTAVFVFNKFAHFTFDAIKIKVNLSGSRFNQGGIMIAFIPTMNKGEQVSEVLNWQRLLSSDYMMTFEPIDTAPKVLTIPWKYMNDLLRITNQSCLGQLVFLVRSQLRGPTGGPTSMNFQVYVSFVNPVYKGLRATIQQIQALFTDMDDLRIQPQGLEGILDTVDKFLPVVSAVDDIFGLLHNPTYTPPHNHIVKKKFQKDNYGVGGTDATILGPINPIAQQFIDKAHFNTTKDEMDIKNLVRKWGYRTSFDWTTSHKKGDILTSLIVSPTHMRYADSGNFANIFAFSQLFDFWRGSIEFNTKIFSSAVHEGALTIAFQPFQSTGSADLKVANSQYAFTYQLKNINNQFTVLCPQHAETPFRRVWRGQDMAENYEPNDTFGINDFISGVLTIYVASPLIANANTNVTVNCQVSVRAGPDFELHKLSSGGCTFIPYMNNEDPYPFTSFINNDTRKKTIKKTESIEVIEDVIESKIPTLIKRKN
nr:RdRp [Picornaviridae sp.]